MSQDEELDTLAGRYEFNGVISEWIINQTFRNTLEKYIKSREATLVREARLKLWKEVVGSIDIPAYRNKAVARVLIPMYREKLRELTNQQKGEQ